MDALAVAHEHVERLERAKPPRRQKAQERVYRHAIARRPEVGRGSERIAAHERALLPKPERDLVPARDPDDLEDVEGRARNAVGRRHVMRYAEPAGELGRIAPVPVDELDDGGRLAQRADALLHVPPIDGVDHPHAPVCAESVRGTLEQLGLGGDPPEPTFELVYEANLQINPFSDGWASARAGSSCPPR